jgi:hypothetical protein
MGTADESNQSRASYSKKQVTDASEWGNVGMLERMQFLAQERNWHIESIERLNARVAFGGSALLIGALLGAGNLSEVTAVPHGLRAVCAALYLGGAACVSIAFVINWRFREARAQECASAMRRSAEGLSGWGEMLTEWLAFEPLPRCRAFGWTLGLGAAMLAGSVSLLALGVLL